MMFHIPWVWGSIYTHIIQTSLTVSVPFYIHGNHISMENPVLPSLECLVVWPIKHLSLWLLQLHIYIYAFSRLDSSFLYRAELWYSTVWMYYKLFINHIISILVASKFSLSAYDKIIFSFCWLIFSLFKNEPHECSAHGGQKRELNAPELKLQTVESYRMGTENGTQKSTSDVDHWAIFPGPSKMIFFFKSTFSLNYLNFQ